MLRGIDQLGEHDITRLEKMKLQASDLQMEFLAALLTGLIEHSRERVFAVDKQQELAPVFFQVAAYVQLLQAKYE
ncbi:hypothetical protein D3C75_1304310 [compost metagenome]